MRAISLWQPWASAVALGSKVNETRSWSTPYRGPLLIHAAKRKVISELVHYESCRHWCGALSLKQSIVPDRIEEKLAFGAIVGIVELFSVRPTRAFTDDELDAARLPRIADLQGSDLFSWTERQMGNYSLNRYGWEFKNPCMFSEPIPYKGSQGFFVVPDELVREARAAA